MTGSIEGPSGHGGGPHAVLRRPADADESARAARRWWDHDADSYLDEHGDALGSARLLWGPEGLDEADVELLGPLDGRTVLEVGCGAGQGARWAAGRGAAAVGLDVSGRMLHHARRLDEQTGVRGRWLQGDARRLPLQDSSVDVAFSSYGALPFLPDPSEVFAEVARVLGPGGRWAFSVTHPVRWCFSDDPGPDGLVARRSYFDRRAYVEEGPDGTADYVEQHHTLSDLLDPLARTGFVVERVLEPEWVDDDQPDWGPWSRLRGRVLPGTLVVSASLAG